MTTNQPSPRRMANAIRALAMDAVQAAKSGHPGMPMGTADIAAALFKHALKFDAAAPDWPDRDRFILSAGHGSMLLYALNHLLGYADMPIEELKKFRQIGARTAGHPEFGEAGGIETTTGPLGQGLANAVGMALAERLLNARFGDDLVNHRTYVLAGDGCLMEGVSHEAIDLAGHLQLSKLTVLWDDNKISIDGSTDLATSMDQRQRFEATGWATWAIDGHDHYAILGALAEAAADDRPALIACRTTIGFGAPTKAGTAGSHGAPLGDDEIAGAREALDWPHPPFEIPDDVLSAWRAIGARGAADRAAWDIRKYDHPQADAFDAALSGALPEAFDAAVQAHKKALAEEKPKLATRVASQNALEAIAPALPTLIGGSADLTGSNNTKTKAMRPVARDDFSGDYIHYGVREHGMASAMNGLALHGGVIPYGGTFLVFTDYARPAMRLSALMGQRVVYVMTHDSIGLGEDGPTHQPVEHLAALRAIPNLAVFRPADAVETAEAWAAALALTDRPSVLCLSRQGLATLRETYEAENRVAAGGYVLREADGARDATLIATGSEVEIAVAAADKLAAKGVKAAVVSLACFELFGAQDAATQAAVLGSAPRVAIEAGVVQGWERWIGADGRFVGLSGFGASGPGPALYAHFGLTADAVVDAARAAISDRKQAA